MRIICLFVLHLQLLEQRQADQLEAVLGWPLFTEGEDRLGWLMNFTTVSCRQQKGLPQSDNSSLPALTFRLSASSQ